MEEKICVYCRRTLDLNELLERAGKYRCKDENNCLDYQNRTDPADSLESADYISDVVKSSLREAAQRIAAYKKAMDDLKRSDSGINVNVSAESTAEFAWMKSILDAFALEYKEKSKFIFQYDDAKNNEYRISIDDIENHLHFTVKIENAAGPIYSLIVAKKDTVSDVDHLYDEFIYKSYPAGKKEDVIQDLSVILLAFEGDKDVVNDLLNKFRMDVESRYYEVDARS